MIKNIALITSFIALLFVTNSYCEELKYNNYKGVVTFHLMPAKVIRVNKIVANPKPGTSYIGDDGILVEIDENIELMANWTVVEFRYYQYDTPKVIPYKILSEKKEITVKSSCSRSQGGWRPVILHKTIRQSLCSPLGWRVRYNRNRET